MSEHDIRALLAKIERALGASWIDIADWLRDQNSLDAIEAKLLRGDYLGVVSEVESAARMFATETHGAFVRAGQKQAAWLDEQPQLKDKLVRFDLKNDRAIRAAQRNELELVQGLTAETREVIRNVVVDGTITAINPREMARNIRDAIGLTPQQEKAVRSYRRALKEQDWSNALGRELSSGQGDRTIRRVARDGVGLSDRQIDDLVERYRQNALTSRAETIARTESARNVHAGLGEAFQQAVDRGDLEAGQLVVEWIHANRGPKSRPHHVDLDRTTVKWGEKFTLPSGVRMRWPHDEGAPASEVANCRCTFSTTLA